MERALLPTVPMNRFLALAKQTLREFGEDRAPRLGAALAYYTIFSIGPLLLIAIAMAGIFFGQEAAQGRVAQELERGFGAATAASVEQMIEAAARPKSGMVATLVGVVTLLFGATGVVSQLKDALNTIWNVPTDRKGGIGALVRDRLLSMAMVLGIGFLLLVTLVLDAGIAAMGTTLARFVGGEALLQSIQIAMSLALATVLFAAIFRVLPDLTIAWRDVWAGAALTSLLFVLGKFALGQYLGKAALGSSYGAAGSLVILLVWVYWSSQILFLGAEFTQVWARSHGSLRGDTSKRDARAAAERPEDRPRSRVDPPGSPSSLPPGRSGRVVPVAAGSAAGLLAGVFLGGLSVLVLLARSAKRVLLLPFR